MAKDPVCGMVVDENEARPRETFGNRMFVFCSEACKARFKSAPERYAGAEPKAE
jgi:Cu+-exporting ATPase